MDCYTFVNSPPVYIVFTILFDAPAITMNLMTVVCLLQIIWQKQDQSTQMSHMFKYLLVKAMIDTTIVCTHVFDLRYNTSSQMRTSLAGNIWFVYLNVYVESSLWYASALMEIAATLDCLVLINKQFKWLISRIAFYLIVTFSILFSFAFHAYQFYQHYIGRIEYNNTVNGTTYQVVEYYPATTLFETTELSFNLMLTESIVRDVLFPAILLILNGLILLRLKKVTYKRVDMQRSTLDSQQTQARMVQTAMNAERKKGKMIIAIGINYILGHMIYAAYQIAESLGVDPNVETQWLCVFIVGQQIILISFGTSFIIYYLFNSQFNRFANQNIKWVVTPFKKMFSGLKQK